MKLNCQGILDNLKRKKFSPLLVLSQTNKQTNKQTKHRIKNIFSQKLTMNGNIMLMIKCI